LIYDNDYISIRDCLNGTMAFNNCDMVIGKCLMNEGEWGAQELGLFQQFLKPGMLAVDVGAHVGTHTVPMAKMVYPKGAVVSFEPQRIPHQILCANITLNALDNVFALNAFASKERGVGHTAQYDPRTESNYGAISAGKYWSPDMLLTELPVIAIDDLDLPACHLIKLDCEGGEHDALLGALKTIVKFRPVIYFEATNDERTAMIADLLGSVGYNLAWHVFGCSRTDNYRGAKPVFESYPETNILAAPSQFNMESFRGYRTGDTRAAVVLEAVEQAKRNK
jgi:FkbM family methyltransferase